MLHQVMVVYCYKNAPVGEAALSHKTWLHFYQIICCHIPEDSFYPDLVQ